MTPRVIANGRFLMRPITGVERFGIELFRHLGDRLQVVKPGRGLTGAAGHAWEQCILPWRLGPGSLLWSPANTGPLAVRAQVLTLHDLGPLEHPEWFRAGFAAWYRLFIPVLAKRVRRILTPTLYMKEKIIKRFDLDEGRVVVTGAGVDRKTFHPGAGLPAGTYDLPKSYVLFVGSIEPRKNLAGLVRAWESLKDEAGETQLVIAGETGPAFRGAALQQPAARVRFLGRVPEAHLPGLYAGAALFALPSLEEGFGLGVLEAMACGTPVLTSDGGALPEVVGDAGLIFSLSEPAALAAALQGCLCDAGLRHRLRERGLRRAEQNSWRTAAEKVWRALQDAG